ncbi:MAG: transcriptional regulator [Leifsonia sp.]|nr:transcriptional regulator [Leifsonia sp.]
MGLSRFKVARLLDEARSRGLVKISVDLPADIDVPMGEEFARRFGIRRAVIVNTLGAVDATVPLLGAAAAQYLARVLSPGDLLGMSWGRSLTSTVDAAKSLPVVDVVQLVGGLRSNASTPGAELTRRLASKTGGKPFLLHAPLLVGSVKMAEALRADPSLIETTSRYRDLSVALVGIGAWKPAQSSLQDEFSPQGRRDLEDRGAVADICTFVLDLEGQVLSSDATGRSVGITNSELARVPEVVAVAGGEEKKEAIAASLRSGLVDTLVIDDSTAMALLASSA